MKNTILRLGCVGLLGSGCGPEQKLPGIAVGTPGDTRIAFAEGDNAWIQVASTENLTLEVSPCDPSQPVETTELADTIDLLTYAIPLPAGSWCGAILQLEKPLAIEGQTTNGGSFSGELELTYITMPIGDKLDVNGDNFVLELGYPGWVSEISLGLGVASKMDVDANHPIYPLMMRAMTDFSGLYSDDGDGDISADERTEGVLAASAMTYTPVWVGGGPSKLLVAFNEEADDWTHHQSISSNADEHDIHRILFDGSMFVAVGGGDFGTVRTSLDGTAWTEQTTDTAGLQDIVVDSGQYTAVGYGGQITQTKDLLHWTRVDNSTREITYTGIAFGNGTYVAVGYDDWGGITSFSNDAGRTWTHKNSEFHGRGVAFGAGRFIMVSDTGVATTNDGEIWSISMDAPDDLTAITYSGEKFVAVGDDGVTMVSKDAEFWSKTMVGTVDFNSVAYGNGFFLASSDEGLYRSSDGESWEPVISGLTSEDEIWTLAFGTP
jgi:hypothetical protein